MKTIIKNLLISYHAVHRSHRAGAMPQTPPDGSRYFNHLAPRGKLGLANVEELLSLKPSLIPKGEPRSNRMMLLFTPTVEMDMYGVELVVATYIFSGDFSKGEVLGDTVSHMCSRDALLSLQPRGELVDDVSA
ncbi:hypothetical protein PIB30_009791 [Stylosanthes scabra]|uniref:Uncharacterized protein n=1 Tax=Stylosanthes scabra TaxID=79078 RepID=A0ABU6Y3V2_9FABA|nr:hypothetical protein [Stylosanthes scabra]